MRKQVRGQRDAQQLGVHTVHPEDPCFLPSTAQAGHNPKGIGALASEGGTYHTQTQTRHNNLIKGKKRGSRKVSAGLLMCSGTRG